VQTARRTDVTISSRGGRAFGYWHIRPVVRKGQRVSKHQLLGYILKGWGHVHFAESVFGQYRNPLRPRALTPYRDRTPPVVAGIGITSAGLGVSSARVRGSIDVQADIYDLPQIAPRPPWQVARLTPAIVWWRLDRAGFPITGWNLAVDFHFTLMPSSIYNWIYAPGSWQNKANRPGRYVFWVAHDIDTAELGDGAYTFEVRAADTRGNVGTGSISFNVENGSPPVPRALAPGMWRAR
jgi:hypothetical protein